MPLTITAEQFDGVNWWVGSDLLERIEHELSTLLPRGESWNTNVDIWGSEDGDRFDVTRERGELIEVFVRLDVRQLSMPFLSHVLEMARRYQLLLRTEGSHILRPSLRELLSAIHRSSSFAFVTNPNAFLSELSKCDRSPGAT